MTRKSVRAGDRVTLRRTVSGEDVAAFGELSQDYNPAHFDDDYASRTIYGRRIAHGLVPAALVSGALTELMGPGNVMLSLELDFRKPVFVGDEVECTLTVVGIDRRKVATLKVEILNATAETVIAGTVTCMGTSASA
jgi:3-hydroxybutyryl-CoA dehydratase